LSRRSVYAKADAAGRRRMGRRMKRHAVKRRPYGMARRGLERGDSVGPALLSRRSVYAKADAAGRKRMGKTEERPDTNGARPEWR
jgi:hypothetical protein